jgi:predicted Zn-dependent protease
MNNTHCFVLMLVLMITGSTHAEPFTPIDDDQVLQRLPVQLFQSKNRTTLKVLRTQYKAHPQDWVSVSQLAQSYIDLAQTQADPRYMGYAQAILTPWWENTEPSTQALIMRAVIRQNAHDFIGANSDLEQILSAQPGHIQANFVKATIATVQGDYQAAIQHCQHLIRRSSMMLGLICQSTPASLSGQAKTSYQVLKQILLSKPLMPEKQMLWAWTSLAEIAWRSGKFEAADDHFQTALQISVMDMYLQRVYADFLLQQHRPTEVINQIGFNTTNDALLLRLALAEQMINSAQLDNHISILTARFKANRKRGSSSHQGDEARFKLHLLNQPQAALQLARQNWQLQREPADTYILLQSAIATNAMTTIRDIEQWLIKQGTDDVLMTELLATAMRTENVL